MLLRQMTGALGSTLTSIAFYTILATTLTIAMLTTAMSTLIESTQNVSMTLSTTPLMLSHLAFDQNATHVTHAAAMAAQIESMHEPVSKELSKDNRRALSALSTTPYDLLDSCSAWTKNVERGVWRCTADGFFLQDTGA